MYNCSVNKSFESSVKISEILAGLDENTRLPYGVSRYYASLAETKDANSDPIAAQFVPRSEENLHLDYESPDPISDRDYLASPRLIHHYKDRVLLLVNDRCATYCRHCFRRHFTGHSTGRITQEQVEAAGQYISSHEEVHEVLLSGGDPLMLSDGELCDIIKHLNNAAPERKLLFRLATRMPVVLPSRITKGLVEQLMAASEARIWVVTHANHPRELSAEAQRAFSQFIESGIPVMNQAVLLKGVNDNTDTLEALFRGLYKLRVRPYYLFQGDLAAGTSHFRVNLERALDIVDELKFRLSPAATPNFAVDLPQGGGKIILDRSRILRSDADWYYLLGYDKIEYKYPKEDLGGKQ